MDFGRRVNLHTHTRRCKHADGDVADYCRAAIGQGVAILGFSEHSPFPDERYGQTRMYFRELADYFADIERARDMFPELVILAGLEVDVDACYGFEFVQREFLDRWPCDFLIAGTHFIESSDPREAIWTGGGEFTPETVRKFARATIRLIESGLFDYITHPDLWARCCPRWSPELVEISRDLIQAAIACDVPLEVNAYGMRKPMLKLGGELRYQYPWAPFWELAAELGARVVVGADGHTPADAWGNAGDAVEFARRCGLTPDNEAVAAKILARRAAAGR